MDPIKSWALVFLGTGAAYWYYTHHTGQKKRPGKVVEPARARQNRREDTKLKRGRDGISDFSEIDALSSDIGKGESKKKRNRGGKAKTEKSPAPTPAAPVEPQVKTDEPEEVIDNKEFAKQMAGVKAGTSLNASADPKSNTRSVRQRHAADTSSSTSTTGDDRASSPADNTSADYVADMLEAPASAAGVLRLTQPNQPMKKKQQKPKAEPAQQETKRQRQQRKKREAEKAMVQEAEKQRRVQLEAQLRTAREAEGRPAKNGMGSDKSGTGSWTTVTKPSGRNKGSDEPLLDTFDADRTDKNAASGEKWAHDLPSEEEQMRLINEMDEDAGWNTVTAKKGKKKAKANPEDSTGNDTSDAGSVFEKVVSSVPVAATPVPLSIAQQRWTPHPKDSDWAVC